MKKIYTVVALLVLTFLFSFSASAQVSAAYASSYQQMMMADKLRAVSTEMSMNSMASQGSFYGFVNNKYTFKVVMKDNSILEVKSEIFIDTLERKSYLKYSNKNLKRSDPNHEQKIYPHQTLKISREQVTHKEHYDVNGIATDSCWLFKVVNGKINAYSQLSEVTGLNTYYLRAFQIGDGPIQKIDSASLASVIKTDPKAMKAFMKKDYYKAIDRYNSNGK